jgi:hypothetical protein
MSNKPSHTAYVVTDAKDGEEKATWYPIGAVWPHRNGKGFDLIIPPGVTVSGRIVCTERKDKLAE